MATTSSGTLSADAEAMSRLTLLRLSQDEAGSGDRITDIAVALAKGKVYEAERLLDGVEDEKFRAAVAQTIARVAFDLHLAKSELDEALFQARKLENHEARAIAFAQLARVARAKREREFSKAVVGEALSFFTGSKPSGLQARALLMLAPEALDFSVADSLDLLRRAVSVINDLPEVSLTEVSAEADAYNLDDPLSLKDGPELQRAFSAVASRDFESILLIARQIEPRLIGLLSRLATVETVLKQTRKTRQPAAARIQRENPFELAPTFLQRAKADATLGVKVSLKSRLHSDCACRPCMVKASLSRPTPGPWWDCTSECMRSLGVSPIALALCGTSCATGVVPVCAVCLALHITAFNFCATYCAAHNPTASCTNTWAKAKCLSLGEDWSELTCACEAASPVIIDVNGDGFSLTNKSAGVSFDINGDGQPEQIGWTAHGSDDAWLFLDRNDNGVVDNGRELFGNFTPQPSSDDPNGFIALAEYDKQASGGNSDGLISSGDTVFASLRLWRDANHNGISEASELRPLTEFGIEKLEIEYKDSRRTDEHGNRFLYRAKVKDAQGQSLGRWAWDVFLVH